MNEVTDAVRLVAIALANARTWLEGEEDEGSAYILLEQIRKAEGALVTLDGLASHNYWRRVSQDLRAHLDAIQDAVREPIR